MSATAHIDTNLQGQKLGRKGRITRERIITAARELIEDPGEEPLSLSAVARRADLRLSSIYNYFADFTELFLAVIEPIVAHSEEGYLSLVRDYWPDADLEERCRAFVQAFHDFWRDNTHLLHLRNQLSDQHDARIARQRISMARTVIRLLGKQMGGQDEEFLGPEFDLASVLFTGLERVVTVATDERWKVNYPPHIKPRFEGKTLQQQTRVLCLAIADERKRRLREAH